MKKILSIDGGGIRGIIPAVFLDRLEKEIGKPIYQMFDIIAGTSTGAILALGLSTPALNDRTKPRYSAEDMVNIYDKWAKDIFYSSILHKITTLDGLIEEKYSSGGIESVMKKLFSDTNLSESLTSLIIPAYEIVERVPFFFKTEDAKKNKNYDFPMWKVARATAAAPTYFEPYKLKTEDTVGYYTLIDGGVFANNPAMCALAEVDTARIITNNKDDEIADGEDILMVSLGTGEYACSLAAEKADDWGLLSWAGSMLDIVFDGVSKTVDYQLRRLLNKNYYRFQIEIQENQTKIDDVSERNLHELKVSAKKMIDIGNFDELCSRLAENTIACNSNNKI